MKKEISRDLQIAKALLPSHSVVFCKEGETLVSDKRGISPLMDFIREGRVKPGCAVADKIVGAAAAWLFVLLGAGEVYASVLSASGEKILKSNRIEYSYGELTEVIINRRGDGACPMETAVCDCATPDEAYERLAEKLSELP